MTQNTRLIVSLVVAILAPLCQAQTSNRLGTHTWYQMVGSHRVDWYFDSSEGVAGTSASIKASAWSVARTHPSDPSNFEDCQPIIGAAVDADALATFGAVLASPKVEVTDPNDPD